jgi:hypothetical protein
MRGELDWIVMKALEKDRNRRYETASGFASDVQRYLADEPVQACPPSAWYRFSKTARRNRTALVTAALVASALVLGTALSTWQAIRAVKAERLTASALQVAEQQQRLARQAVDEMYTQFSEKVLADRPHLEKVQKDFLEKALAYYQKFSQDQGTDPRMLRETS